VEKNPGSPLVHQANGLFLAAEGRAADAIAEADRVLDLDPVSSSSGCTRSRLLYYARRYDDAIAQYETTLSYDPTVAGFCAFAIFAYQQKGRLDDAIATAKRIAETSPNEMLPRAALARSYGVMGNTEEARKVVRAMEELSKKRFISEYDFAVAHSGWDEAGALRWLEKAWEGRAGLLVYARADANWDGLRSNPRFQDLVRKIGIPE